MPPLDQAVHAVRARRQRPHDADAEHDPAERVRRTAGGEHHPDDREDREDRQEEDVVPPALERERDRDDGRDRDEREDPPREPSGRALLHGATSGSVTRTRKTSTGSSRPFTCREPIGSDEIPGAEVIVVELATISPPSASLCRRWATFTASPITVYSSRPPPPIAPATT